MALFELLITHPRWEFDREGKTTSSPHVIQPAAGGDDNVSSRVISSG
ncbi:hypothetical protein LAD67_03765 [Escherichia coli]|nr:hypothetical protein [Escherichia coli]